MAEARLIGITSITADREIEMLDNLSGDGEVVFGDTVAVTLTVLVRSDTYADALTLVEGRLAGG